MAAEGNDYIQNIKSLMTDLLNPDARKRRCDMDEINSVQRKRKRLFIDEPARIALHNNFYSPNYAKPKVRCCSMPAQRIWAQSKNSCVHATEDSEEIEAFNCSRNCSRNHEEYFANGDHYDQCEEDYEDFPSDCHNSSRSIRTKCKNILFRNHAHVSHSENRCIRQLPKPKQLSPYNFIDRDKYQELINNHTPKYDTPKSTGTRNSLDFTHLLVNPSKSITTRIVNSVIDYELNKLKTSSSKIDGFSKFDVEKSIDRNSVMNCDKVNISFLNFRNEIELNSTTVVNKSVDKSETSSRITKEDVLPPENKPAESDNTNQECKPIKDLLEKTICQKQWLDSLNESFESKIQLKLKLIETESRRKNAFSDHNRGYDSELEDRIEKSLLSKLFFEPLEEVGEDSFPELSEDQERTVTLAWKGGPPHQVVAEKFNMSITRSDLLTLAGLNWLNDEVINFYMNLLMDRSKNNANRPKVYATNTFFYPKLMQGGQASLRRWTKKVDIFAHDLMLVPVHLSVHWCMAVIDFREKAVKYYDSMGGHNQQCVNALIQYLIDECLDKKKENLNVEEWSAPATKSIPQQMNGSDCGVFSCTFAEFESRDAKFTFSQDDMPYLRRKMVYEIITGKLLLD